MAYMTAVPILLWVENCSTLEEQLEERGNALTMFSKSTGISAE